MSLPVALPRARLKLGYRLANRLGGAASRLGLTPELSAEWIAEAACRRTGRELSPALRTRLERLAAAMQSEAQLTLVGRVAMRGFVLSKLLNHAAVQHTLEAHPEIAQVPVERPIFVIGLPRSGTTFLHRLLAAHPDCRSFQLWELLRPVPPPEEATYHAGPRSALRSVMSATDLTLLDSMHETRLELPEECTKLLMNDLMSPSFAHTARVPSYVAWYLEQDLSPTYALHRAQVQLLTWRFRRPRVVMKSPVHLFALDALRAAYPDACLVWLHRDPAEALASMCRLFGFHRSQFSGAVDGGALARELLGTWTTAAERAAACRGPLGESLVDVTYDELVRQPLSVVQRICEHFGLRHDETVRAAVTTLLPASPPAPGPAKRDPVADLGLDADDVRRRFAGALSWQRR